MIAERPNNTIKSRKLMTWVNFVMYAVMKLSRTPVIQGLLVRLHKQGLELLTLRG